MKKITLPLLFLLLLVNSCKKDRGTDPDGEKPETPINISLKDAQVTLPAGSNYDLNSTELLVLGHPVAVGKDGSTQVLNVTDKNQVNFSFLFDEQDRPILIGVVNGEGNAEISTRSTAKVLLHYALGLPFQTDTLTGLFFAKAEELNGVSEWLTTFENIWKNDPLTLSTGSFLQALREAAHKVLPGDRGLRVEKLAVKASDLRVDANDVRSGLQLHEDGLGKLAINNNYRRRGHAFIYKMKYKDNNNIEHTVLPNIGNSTKANIDFSVDPIAAVNSAMGEIGKWIEGTDMESFLKKSGPVTLDLQDHEDEATYKVRIVGPGKDNTSGQVITEDELYKATRLEVETFMIDFVIPAITTGMGTVGLVDDIGKGTPGYEIGKVPENLIKAGELFLGAAPDIYDEIKKGDYQMALRKTLEHLAGAIVKDEAKMLVDICLHMAISRVATVSAGNLTEMVGRSMGRILNSITVMDIVMQGNDLRLVATHAASSRRLEEWTVVARSSKVTLEPNEAKVIPFSQQKITATIKNLESNDDTHPYFEWSTSGKWGYLRDTRGHQGTSFDSADQEVFYNCNSNTGLTDDDNWEYIYVKAYMGSTLIGTDTARINVRRSAYRISPNGITVTGRKSGSSELANSNEVGLSIEPINSSIPPIAANDKREYKVVWITAGKHGGLYGRENITPSKTITNYDDNKIWYECTDDQTRSGVETVTARIYARDKHATNEPFQLFDELTGTVRINNDPKIRIVHLPVQVMKGDAVLYDAPHRDSRGNTYYTHQCYEVLGATFQQKPEDDRYSITFYTAHGHTESGSWRAGDAIGGFTHGDNHPAYDGSTYKVGTGLGGWGVGPYYPSGGPAPTCTPMNVSADGATCVLTITLK